MTILPPVKRIRKPASRFHHGDLRAAAIEVAVREVEARGHDRLTLERVATKLGVTRPALYRHFADRRALLQEVVQHGFVGFEAALTNAFLAEPEPWNALRAAGRAYIDYCVAHPGWHRLQFSTRPEDRPKPDLQAAPPRYATLMFGVLNEAFGQEEAMLVFRGMWSMVHGMAALTVEDVFADTPSAEERSIDADAVLRLHVGALRTYAARLRS